MIQLQKRTVFIYLGTVLCVCFSSIASSTVLLSAPSYAHVNVTQSLHGNEACKNATDNDGEDGCKVATSSGAGVTPESIAKNGINTALIILGSVSVLMIVYAGFRFSLAGGDPQTVKAARNTILYAVAGLVIAIMSYSVVNWITDNLLKI